MLATRVPPPPSGRAKPSRNTAALNTLDMYFDEIGQEALLTEADERDLGRRARDGDESATRELVARNLRFVVSVAKRYQNRGLPLDDLIAEGNVGLLAAARRFDPGQEVRFITYAVWWVRQAILMALAKQGRLVRVPAHRLAAAARLARVRNTLRGELGREPSSPEVAARADVPEAVVDEWRSMARIQVSFDAPLSNSDARCLGDHLAVEPDPLETDYDSVQATSLIERALSTLLPREAAIIRRHFGLGSEEGCTLDDIATDMGITRERVRQLRDRALGKLRFGKYADVLAALAR